MKRILFFLLLLSSFAKAQTKTGDIYLRPQYNVLKYGAVDDSVTDCLAAFKAAAAAAKADGGGNIFVPSTKKGFYLSDSVQIASGVNVVGVASLSASPSRIISKSATKSLFVAESGAGGEGFYNLRIVNQNATGYPTAGAGIRINGSSTGSFNIHNVTLIGFYTGIDIIQGTQWTIDGGTYLACVLNGISVGNISNADQGDNLIDNCYFANLGVGTPYAGVNWHGSGGMKVNNSKFNSGNGAKAAQFKYCIAMNNTDGATSDFSISNTSFENYDSTAIYGLFTNVFRHILIDNVQIDGNGSFGAGINIGYPAYNSSNGEITISNYTITDFATTSARAGIAITNANFVAIGKGVINTVRYTASPVITTTGCTNVSVDDAYLLTSSQVEVSSGTGVSGSSDLTFTGNVLTLNDALSLGLHTGAVGINPKFSNPSTIANLANVYVTPASGTNVTTQLNLIPKGTGTAANKSTMLWWGTDFTADATNYQLFFIRHTGAAVNFISTSGGSGTLVPIAMSASASQNQFNLFTSASVSGNVGINSATDNSTAFLQVNGTTQAQLALHYDASNKTQFTTSSTGNLTIAPSGGQTSLTGSITHSYRAITALRTLDATDYLINCTSNSFTVTLPTAVGITGRQYIIKNTGGATTITIATTSAQTIDGSAPGTITTLVPLRVMSDGANWITF